MAEVQYQQHLLTSLMSMAAVVEARDAYTGGHLWRVSQFSRRLALKMGLGITDATRIEIGGFLHDVGKIAVPDAILNKRDRLTDEEYAVIKTHPQSGADLLAQHPLAALAMEAVLMHHETPDGKGYPAGLMAEQIPLNAKIIGVCDAFDAMTSTRPYRAGMSLNKVLGILQQEKGRQFDARCADVLCELAEDGAMNHIIGHSEPGIPIQQCVACGPTLVVPHHYRDGELLACPACHGEYQINARSGVFNVRPTGHVASAALYTPSADVPLIKELVSTALHQWQGLLAG